MVIEVKFGDLLRDKPIWQRSFEQMHQQMLLFIVAAIGYILLLTTYWLIGFAIIFCLALSRFVHLRLSTPIIIKRVLVLVILILLAVASLPCSFYGEISEFVVESGYTVGVAFLLLPNLYYIFMGIFGEFSDIVVYAINLLLFFALFSLLLHEEERCIGVRKLLKIHIMKVRRVKVSRNALRWLFLLFCMLPIFLMFLKLFYGTQGFWLFSVADMLLRKLRITTVVIPYLVLPLVIIWPRILEVSDQFLKKELAYIGKRVVKCYHFMILFIILWFLFLDLTHVSLNDPNLCMTDDRHYFRIWTHMRSGASFYEAWARENPENTEAHIHWSAPFFIWALCKNVWCIKLEYFILGAVSLICSFFFAKKMTENYVIGILSMLYLLCFYSRGFFWFMLDHWATVPEMLGLVFMVFQQHVLSAIFLGMSFFFKESFITVIASTAAVFALWAIYLHFVKRTKISLVEYGSYSLAFLAVISFIAYHSATYAGPVFSKFFFGEIHLNFLLHHFCYYMYPIGLVNFLLAILGILSISDRKIQAVLLAIIVVTHLSFLLIIHGCSDVLARNAAPAVFVEFLLAPLGIATLSSKS